MKMGNWTRRASKGLQAITDSLVLIAAIALAGIILIVVVDVSGRYLLNKALLGSDELVEQGMGILAGLAIMYAAAKNQHVSIDLIVGRFPARVQLIMQCIFSLLGSATSFLLSYRVWHYALYELKLGSRTITFEILKAPISFVIAIAFFLTGLIFLVEAFHLSAPGETSEVKE